MEFIPLLPPRSKIHLPITEEETNHGRSDDYSDNLRGAMNSPMKAMLLNKVDPSYKRIDILNKLLVYKGGGWEGKNSTQE
jgi:hypothetical protein